MPEIPSDETAPASSTSASSDNAKSEPPRSEVAADQPGATQQEQPQPPADPVRELLNRMNELEPFIAGGDRELAQTIRRLVQQGEDPDRHAQPGFRHQVAYALQDIEKNGIELKGVEPSLRTEMARRAASAPALESERVLALMATTASTHDKSLIREIRLAGYDIGRQQDQHTPETQSRIDALENRARLSRRPAEAEQHLEAADRLRAGRVGQNGQKWEGQEQAPDTTQTPHGPQTGQGVRTRRNPFDTVLSAMRPREPASGAPWDPPPTPMAERISMFEKKMMEAADERTFERAMKSGRAALDAMQSFANGEGAAIINRVQEAARHEPGGMASVLSEMREGGKFSELRKQFSTALETDRGLASAYDKAAGALQRYGQDRSIVQDIIGRRPDPTAMTARFEEMDAEIGKAASSTPSRNDGHSMLDDLTKKAAELLQKAVDTVRSAFSRSPSGEVSARPSPSPSMS